MIFPKKQIFLISLLLSFCMFTTAFTESLYAESLISKLKTKASDFINKQVEKYTSRDFWVDKASNTIATKLVSKPVKLATSALGMALGTAIGGPVGATVGAYVGSKIAEHACNIIAKPIVKNVINDKLDNGGSITVKSIFNACKSLDMPELASDTTGSIVGDILGTAIGGIAGAAIMACVGGGTVLPIIGTITFATLGSKYGEKLGNWIGEKLGRNAYNSTYKVITGKDRNEGASDNAIKQTLNDIKSVDKKEVAKKTTSGIVGDVIGSAIGTVAGATLSAFTIGGSSSYLARLGEKWGSKMGTKIGNWVGDTFFKDKKENKPANDTAIAGSGTTITVHDEIPVYSSVAQSPSSAGINLSYAEAAYTAYQISYDNYARVLADSNSTQEQRQKAMKEYHACFQAYQNIICGK